MNSESRLVYSSNPELNRKCPKCGELVSECVCVADEKVDLKSLTVVLRIETNGRGGKTVTVVDRLPKADAFLKELCTELKKKCGSGGTYLRAESGGQVEIQGDKRETIRALLEKKGMKVKG